MFYIVLLFDVVRERYIYLSLPYFHHVGLKSSVVSVRSSVSSNFAPRHIRKSGIRLLVQLPSVVCQVLPLSKPLPRSRVVPFLAIV